MPPKRKASSGPAKRPTKKRKTTEKKEKTPVKSKKSSNNKEVAKGVSTTSKMTAAKSGNTGTDLISLIKDGGWRVALEEEFKQPYMVELVKKLDFDYKTKKIFPPKDLIFNALNLTPIEDIKVVIIGQDPYHDDGQAMGLCFSVPKGIAVPPSLKNIYKELETDIPGFKNPGHGDLTKWAEEGVFILNATLTVEAHKPNSHKDYGWQKLTDRIIQIISEQCNKVVFILWGNFAQKKGKIIDDKKHCVIKSGHPSPLSVKYFLGSKCFSKTNEALKKFGRSEIDWKL